MVTPHAHVRRSPALEAALAGDLVSDPDLELFNRFVPHSQPLNKALIGMLAPGLVLSAANLLWTRCRRRRRTHGHDDARRGADTDDDADDTTALESLAGAFAFCVYHFYLPVALTWMSTGFVNSATHLWGDQVGADDERTAPLHSSLAQPLAQPLAQLPCTAPLHSSLAQLR